MFVFDMDGTLTPSRWEMEPDMVLLFKELLKKYKVWIISGWDYVQFQIQILQFLWDDENLLKNLYICPTNWTKMYIYNDIDWQCLYSLDFTKSERKHIINVLENAIEKLWLKPEKTYWDLVEDRKTQITYATLWQQAARELKSAYDPDFSKRKKIVSYIKPDLEWFDIFVAWNTSIDITREWVDKAYWIEKLMEKTWLNKNEIIFIWDRIFSDWNDYPPLNKLWITTKKVFSLEDTKDFIREMVK